MNYLRNVPVTHSGKRALITLPHTLRRKCAPLKVLACKKALYVNKESFSTLYSHKDPFYTLMLSKGHIFCVKYAVKLLVPSSRNESPAHFVDSSFRDDSWADELEHRRFRAREAPNLRAEGAQARVDMSLYELVETAQAILINYILIDGSAQAVSHIVGFISAWIKSLR